MDFMTSITFWLIVGCSEIAQQGENVNPVIIDTREHKVWVLLALFSY